METKPFGELSRSEQVALFETWLDGHPIECRSSIIHNKWTRSINPLWGNDFCYRIAAIPDSINWDHVHPDFKYMARNGSGSVYLFSAKPHLLTRIWASDSRNYVSCADCFSSYKKGTTDWKDSLVERPS